MRSLLAYSRENLRFFSSAFRKRFVDLIYCKYKGWMSYFPSQFNRYVTCLTQVHFPWTQKKDTHSLKQRHNSTFKQRHIATLIRFNKIEFLFNIEIRRCFNVNVVSTCICLMGDDLYLFGGQRSGSNLDFKCLTVSGPFLHVMVILHSCVDHIQKCTSIDFESESQRSNSDFRPLTITAW